MVSPGAQILCEGKGPSSLGCFAYRYAKKNTLYGVMAAHGAAASKEVSYGGGQVLGKVVEIDHRLDCALVQLPNAVSAGLAEANFHIAGLNKALTAVFPFSEYWKIIASAKTQAQEDCWAAMGVPVVHSGYKTNRENAGKGVKATSDRGEVRWGRRPMNKLQMTTRLSRAGDSGGPVYNSAGKLVGFISMGGTSGQSTQTTIVVAEKVFEAMDLALATWQNRTEWQPAAASAVVNDPFADITLTTW